MNDNQNTTDGISKQEVERQIQDLLAEAQVVSQEIKETLQKTQSGFDDIEKKFNESGVKE